MSKIDRLDHVWDEIRELELVIERERDALNEVGWQIDNSWWLVDDQLKQKRDALCSLIDDLEEDLSDLMRELEEIQEEEDE